ncbi:MAG: FtsW/RodA/SpoVE family cell cycle protein [Lentihominibacter sp.]|jgi:cell division protein FtsW
MDYEMIIETLQLYFTTGVRWVFVGLAVVILLHQIIALLRMRNPSEIWAFLQSPDGSKVPLTHWENLVGRARGCDIIINLASVSRSHATLIRDSEGVWKYNDLESKNGSLINGQPVKGPTVVRGGDVMTIGGSDFILFPLSLQERMENIEKRRRKTKTTSPWLSMIALTIFQVLAVAQFKVSLGEDFPPELPLSFALICILMWVYVIVMRMFKRTGFELEIIAFFLATLSLAVTTSALPDAVFKQAVAVVLGVALFFVICWILRDLNQAKKLIYILIGASMLLLIINLIFGAVKHGAQNWVTIGGFSFQPSELVKIVFIYVGAASLDELQQKKNLYVFMGFSVFCLGSLAIMGDFGTAMIFFATFLIISFLRSGDFTKIALILGAAGLMGLMVLRFKPYVAARFETWGHVWEDPTGGGFQQVQTMTSIASGGLPGLGAGEGNLCDVAASSTDLVFGLLAEEWGLVIAVLAVLCIFTFGIFAYRTIIAGRSTYYSIAACSATSLFIIQTMLNVFGSIDILPLTGVTFPFVSSGGTSMIASWGLLAFVKAADTRQNASIAVKLDRKSQYEDFEFEERVEKRIAPYREPRREYPDYPPQSEQKVRPKDISYNDMDDDDFFSQFNDESDPRRRRR